jgi:ADP-heptose:LPS heptosyltransferase
MAGGAPQRVLVARADNVGDVLLAGPAVRAVAASGHEVVFLAGPVGASAAQLLPGVAEVITCRVPWIEADPDAVDREALDELVDAVRRRGIGRAAILTSSHQSALPLALLLRLAGVGEIAAVSHEYPGSLLDHRIPGDPDVHEVERNLAVVARLGYRLPPGDAGQLAIVATAGPEPPLQIRAPGAVVVHPGASVPARTLAPQRWQHVITALVDAGHDVVVTGASSERAVVDEVLAGVAAPVVDLAGRTSLCELAVLLREAGVLVTGNTGPMHLAAAVQTPVVAVFPPTVRPARWRPWMTEHTMLGLHDIACGDCRSRRCPLDNQPCLAGIRAADVVSAVEHLVDARRSPALAGAPR